MYRLLLVVMLMLALVTQVGAQDKKDGEEKKDTTPVAAKTAGDDPISRIPVPFPVVVTETVLTGPIGIVIILVLFLLVMILFQLYLLRGSIEKMGPKS
jgi:hypothetical protein